MTMIMPKSLSTTGGVGVSSHKNGDNGDVKSSCDDYCKICLSQFDDREVVCFEIRFCKCRFCSTCLNQYIRQCVENFNVLPIFCPDPKCRLNGVLAPDEIKKLLLSPLTAPFSSSSSSSISTHHTFDSNNNEITSISRDPTTTTTIDNKIEFAIDDTCQTSEPSSSANFLSYYKKYLKITENIEIIRDPNRTYCPVPTCENVCRIERPLNETGRNSFELLQQPVKVTCNKCHVEFCSNCFRIESSSSSTTRSSPSCRCKSVANKRSSSKPSSSSWTMPVSNRLMSSNSSTNGSRNDEIEIEEMSSSTKLLFDFENIKQCPKCATLFERADGCAQIMCKCCKHTFCFYCLKSLENDFLLKHYTKNGPCQGKLGHSRISLFFHRIRVMAVFSGTIILVILLSPFILLLLPCFILSNRFRGVCYKFLEKYM